jgi:cephalosporin hydroxylase
MSIDITASLEASARQNFEGMVKTWEDVSRYEAIIEATRPDLIIECGTFSGKSAVWFAGEGDGCAVLTIDVTPHIGEGTRDEMDRLGVWDVVGSSTDPDIVHKVSMFARSFGNVMVVLDSDHSAAHVAAEMAAYGPLVTPGCYMVVEDGILRYMPDEERRHYDGNPLDAIEAFMADCSGLWEIDVDIENMHPVTQFPSGWLRRL